MQKFTENEFVSSYCTSCMYIWFLLGRGVATGEMRTGNTRKSISSGLVLPGMLGAKFSFILLRIRHVYGYKNNGIVYTLAASPVKYFLKLKLLQNFSLFN